MFQPMLMLAFLNDAEIRAFSPGARFAAAGPGQC
jgi:hypothetical protein